MYDQYWLEEGGARGGGSTEYLDSCACTRPINVPITISETFTGSGYAQFQQIVVKLPLYNSIQQVAPTTLVQSWTQSTNATDYILTFNMVLVTSHVTGTVAQLQIAAESGTVTNYNFAIN